MHFVAWQIFVFNSANRSANAHEIERERKKKKYEGE